jgi:hypothetical protein
VPGKRKRGEEEEAQAGRDELPKELREEELPAYQVYLSILDPICHTQSSNEVY